MSTYFIISDVHYPFHDQASVYAQMGDGAYMIGKEEGD